MCAVFVLYCAINLFVVDLWAASITISWQAPTVNADGTALTDLEGYKVYYGTASRGYSSSVDAGYTTSYQINDLTEGSTYYFAITAYDAIGNESGYSNELIKSIPLPPPPPEPAISVTDSAGASSDLSIPFGNVTEGSTLNHTVTVSNPGNVTLVVGTIAQANMIAAPFSILNNTCSGKSIAPSVACTLTVRFSPSGTGAFSDTFDIPSNDSSQSTVTISVSGTGVTNNSPTANTGGPYSSVEGQAITLNGSVSADPDGSITLYEWDINNDGTYDYSTSNPTRSHTYAQQGTYTIKLRVTDNLGKTGTASITAVISDTSPTADFTAGSTSGTAPLSVSYSNTSAGYDQPLTYAWDFDNNGTTDSTLNNPSYTYNDAGTYTVKLTVTDSDGSTKTLTRTSYITVALPLYTLTVNASSNGAVNSSPSGIQCPGTCSKNYTSGIPVTLTATPQSGYLFDSWSNCANPSGNQCSLTINADIAVTANFMADIKSLTCTDGGNIACLERTDSGSDSNNLVNNKPKIDVEYKFQITMRDITGTAPQYVKLYMTQRTVPVQGDFYSYDLACSGDYSTGSLCIYTTKLGPAAAHTFYYEAKISDGTTLRYPKTGYITGPEIRLLQGYPLLGIPRASDNNTLIASTAFGSSIAYRWSEDLGHYIKLADTDPVTPGEGYFVSKRANANTLPELNQYAERTDAEFVYRLTPGWNIISNPYSGNVTLSDVKVRKGSSVPVAWTTATATGWVTNAVYYSTGKDWGSTYTFETAPGAKIVPWLGYWVHVNAADDIYYLVIPRPKL